MKHFFIIFLLFVWGATASAFGLDGQVVARVQSFKQSLNDDFERAKNLSRDELSLREHPENFTVFSPILWETKDTGPLTGTKGLGPWHENDFLNARWVACYSGTKNTTEIISGIQVVPADGWQLRVPTISSATEDVVQDEVILTPVVHPLPVGQTKTVQYNGNVFFPIFISLKEAGVPAFLQKEMTITGCRGYGDEQECQNAVVPVSLSLTADEHLPTAICGGLIHQLQSTPIPPNGRVDATATVNENGAVQLLFRFQEEVEDISLQIDNDFSFTQQKAHVMGQNAYVVIMPDKPVQPGDVLRVKALSSVGWFDLTLPVAAGDFVVSQPAFSWWGAIKAGLLLFLFSPFYMLFFGWRVSDEKTFKTELNQVRLGIISGAILMGFVWQIGWFNPAHFLSEPVTFAIGMIAAAGLIIAPVTQVVPAFILFWVTPKPFLDETFLQVTGWYPAAVCYLWGFILLMPFNFMHALSDSFFRFYQQMSCAIYQVRLTMRLPMILLLGWGLFVQAAPLLVSKADAPYTPAAVREAVSDGKTVFVTVTDGMDTASAANQVVSGQVYPAKAWRKQGELIFMTVSLQSPDGQNLLRELGLPYRPFAVLYGPQIPSGVIIDGHVRERDWHGLMKRVNPQ